MNKKLKCEYSNQILNPISRYFARSYYKYIPQNTNNSFDEFLYNFHYIRHVRPIIYERNVLVRTHSIQYQSTPIKFIPRAFPSRSSYISHSFVLVYLRRTRANSKTTNSPKPWPLTRVLLFINPCTFQWLHAILVRLIGDGMSLLIYQTIYGTWFVVVVSASHVSPNLSHRPHRSWFVRYVPFISIHSFVHSCVRKHICTNTNKP